ncbi:MAG: large conductance mechanosensitive channel protein MscL [Planctomycetota bacterium]|nr:MAG: large conductance mechanosensitive channel protein MscL [Planctomycetota bacterium]
MLQEFKKFALRGNVVDLAVGVIIGAAFGKIVSSMVDDIMMPPLTLLLGAAQVQNFQDLALPLNAPEGQFREATSAAWAKENHVAAIRYGSFIKNVIDFTIVAFCVFLVVRQFNRFSPPPPAPATRVCPMCHTMISNKASRCPNCTSEIAPQPT